MRHHAHHVISLTAVVGLVMLTVGASPVCAQAARGAEARVLERAIRLLPARPDVPVRMIDPELAPDPGAIRRLDAFMVREPDGKLRRVIYLNRRAAIVDNALTGQDLDVGILAAVIHHEMAHLKGADEAEARRAERAFFQSLVFRGSVPVDLGMRYLGDLEQDRQLKEGR
jgi:hypothetical protein